ncbi:DUF2809 domain-containing protein [Agrobacterium bohemicum]|uniref:ribosomal maturation YjgA family protein n=1 Tax=Agrobacterium bohemicum TaxID=2052828 RepID=UPI0009EB3594
MMIKTSQPFYLRSVGLLTAACLVILAGLALRGYGYAVGLSFTVVKYGGSLLWGSMVYLLVAALMPRHKRHLVTATAAAFSIIVELIRLVHFPALDAFRATTAGALLLGRVF